MPYLNKIVDKYKDEDVVFLAVTFDKDEDVEKFLKKKDFNYTHAAGEMELIRDMGVQSFPTNLIIDQQGEIVFSHNGFSEALMPEIDKTIGQLIKTKD